MKLYRDFFIGMNFHYEKVEGGDYDSSSFFSAMNALLATTLAQAFFLNFAYMTMSEFPGGPAFLTEIVFSLMAFCFVFGCASFIWRGRYKEYVRSSEILGAQEAVRLRKFAYKVCAVIGLLVVAMSALMLSV